MGKTDKIDRLNRSERFKSSSQLLCREIVKLRKLHGLSQKDLADMLEIEPAQLCKLEKGKHLPQVRILERIEERMNLPPQSLVAMRHQIIQDGCYDDGDHFNDPSVRFEPACDREILTISEEDLGTIAETVAPIADRYAAELDKLNRPTFCRVNLGTLRTATQKDGIRYAEGLRDLIGDYTAPLAALLPRLEQLNFRFIPLPTLPPCIKKDGSLKLREAFCFHDQRHHNPVIVVNQQAAPYAQLYGIAYEIGSYLRYQRKLTLRCLRKKEEWEFCRAFATTLLIPTIVIRDLVDEMWVPKHKWTLELVDNLALRFGVSSMAMLYRLLSIGSITKPLFDKFIAQLRQPHFCDDPKRFPPRPPLKFGTWLKTLKLRTAIR